MMSYSLALRQVRNRGYSDEKLFKSLNGNTIVRVLGLSTFEPDGYALMDFELGHAIRGTIAKYCQSDSVQIASHHVPETGLLATLSKSKLEPYRQYIIGEGREILSLLDDVRHL